MAVSRVGGTSGKLRGQVGNTVYQIVRGADGSYIQVTYNKGERIETQTSPRLQAQRMCIAMVESLMRDLKAVGGISMQAGRNKSQSLNSFSSANVRLVQRDMQEHWYRDNVFVFPYHHRTDIDIRDLGGPFMISSGTLAKNIFDEVQWSDYAARDFRDVTDQNLQFFGVKFNCQLGVDTLDSFRKQHRISIFDKFVFAGFYSYLDYAAHPDDPTDICQHVYFIASQNSLVPGNSVITLQLLQQLFKIQSSKAPVILEARNGRSFSVGYLCDVQSIEERFYYDTAFSISQYSGKKQISTSFYQNPEGGQVPWLLNSAPANVFGSWMSEPEVIPYPSPF